MKQTMDQIKTTFATLMQENGFQYTDKTSFNNSFIYAREWRRTDDVLWYGPMETSIRIEAHESYGYPIIHIYRDGRLTEQRDYSSPKRAINAIREILRCAGYTL